MIDIQIVIIVFIMVVIMVVFLVAGVVAVTGCCFFFGLLVIGYWLSGSG